MVAVLFDLTRSFSRRDHANPTGIDRVETALFNALSQLGPVTGLARSGRRCWSADGALIGASILQPAPLDRIARLQYWRDEARRRGESGLRATYGRGARDLPFPTHAGQWLVCVGHTLPDEAQVARWKARGGRLAVLVHDLIPLDHPEWSRPRPAARFATTMRLTAEHADLVLHLTRAGQARWLNHYSRNEGQRHAVLPMGATDLPDMERNPRPRPVMLMIGTIEPRKGHATILDIWDQFAPVADLHIVGRRGWRNAETFARLDARPPGVTEIGEATDLQIAAEISAAHTLLFPSRAEGYGLPVMEARARGLPVLASNLPELREIHGDAIGYVAPNTSDAWHLAIDGRLKENHPSTDQSKVLWSPWIESARMLRALMFGG